MILLLKLVYKTLSVGLKSTYEIFAAHSFTKNKRSELVHARVMTRLQRGLQGWT